MDWFLIDLAPTYISRLHQRARLDFWGKMIGSRDCKLRSSECRRKERLSRVLAGKGPIVLEPARLFFVLPPSRSLEPYIPSLAVGGFSLVEVFWLDCFLRIITTR